MQPDQDPRYEYCSDGSIHRLRPKSAPNPLRCVARPHGLGGHPSIWKAANDHDRAAGPEMKLSQFARIARSQFHGGFLDAPDNDNQAWPLLKSLRQDGKGELIAVAERYRRTHDSAQTQPMGTANPNDLFVVPKYGKSDDPDNRTRGVLETSHTAGEPTGGKVQRETGQIADTRLKAGAPNPARRSTSRVRTDNTEDVLVGIIDARRDLTRLRAVLGPLLGPFEEAVLDGETLADIGTARGIGQHAGGAGKLVVMMGLEAVQAEFRRIDRERRLHCL
jgi:hypothetical protein